jgi:hypothetical protein
MVNSIVTPQGAIETEAVNGDADLSQELDVSRFHLGPWALDTL